MAENNPKLISILVSFDIRFSQLIIMTNGIVQSLKLFLQTCLLKLREILSEISMLFNFTWNNLSFPDPLYDESTVQ